MNELLDDWAATEMERIDAVFGGDPEDWHKQADAFLFKCLFLNLTSEMKLTIVDWFKKGKKWYA